jgi:transmembrane sensor
MSDETEWELLARYIAGESTASERAEVERRAAADPAVRSLLASLERRWRAAAHPHRADVDAAWQRLTVAIGAPGSDVRHPTPARPRARPPARPAFRAVVQSRWRTLPIAAAALLVAGAGLYWSVAVARRDATAGRETSIAAGTVRTDVGERRTFRLSDGSEVILGAASTLRVDSAYGARTREVTLEGEALFRVAHEAARPFVVHAGGTRSEDLGTEFVVRAYPGEGAVRVAVRQGAVALRRERDADRVAVLRPRDVARVDSTGGQVILHDQDLASLTAWTSGTLVFEDAPLSEVAAELQRWYDIQCQFSDSTVAALRYHGTHSQDERIDEILQAIGLSANVRIERTGRVIRFSRGVPADSARALPRGRPDSGV